MTARIALIDDDPDFGALAAASLESLGSHHVIWHATVEALLQDQAAWPCDLVLLDALLEEAGLEQTVPQLRADRRWQHVPVLVLTAFAADQLETAPVGTIGILRKPLGPATLVREVDAILQKRV